MWVPPGGATWKTCDFYIAQTPETILCLRLPRGAGTIIRHKPLGRTSCSVATLTWLLTSSSPALFSYLTLGSCAETVYFGASNTVSIFVPKRMNLGGSNFATTTQLGAHVAAPPFECWMWKPRTLHYPLAERPDLHLAALSIQLWLVTPYLQSALQIRNVRLTREKRG